mgnify:CR=1 FL=1
MDGDFFVSNFFNLTKSWGQPGANQQQQTLVTHTVKNKNNKKQKKLLAICLTMFDIDSVMKTQLMAFAITFRKFDQTTGQPYEFTQGVEIECDDEQHGREILTRAKPVYIVRMEVMA